MLASNAVAWAYVPSAAERAGDFSRNPILGLLYDPITRAPFPSNVIPVSRQTSIMAFRISEQPASQPCRDANLSSYGIFGPLFASAFYITGREPDRDQITAPSNINMEYRLGDQLTVSREVPIRSTGAALRYQLGAATNSGPLPSPANHLIVAVAFSDPSGTPFSGTPARVSLALPASLLNRGLHRSYFDVTPLGVVQTPIRVTVDLNVDFYPPDWLVIDRREVVFRVRRGGGLPSPQIVQVLQVPQGRNFRAAVRYVPANLPPWLEVTPLAGHGPSELLLRVRGDQFGKFAFGTFVAILQVSAGDSGVVFDEASGPGGVPAGDTACVKVVLEVVEADVSIGKWTVRFGGPDGFGARDVLIRVPQVPPSLSTVLPGLSFSAAVGFCDENSNGWLAVIPRQTGLPGTVRVTTDEELARRSVGGSRCPPTTSEGFLAYTAQDRQGGLYGFHIEVWLNLCGGMDDPPGDVPTIDAIVNSASYAPPPLSAGMMVAIFGSNLGPDELAGLSLTPEGSVATAIQSVQVTFDNVPAPLIFVRKDVIACMIPYQAAGRQTTRAVVHYRGFSSSEFEVRLVEAAPGIYTASSTGAGQGSIRNSDNQVNSSGARARRGDWATVYFTGEGPLTPGGVTGGIATLSPLRACVRPVQVTVGGRPARTIYAGAVPDTVMGFAHVSFFVPADAPTGDAVPIQLSISGRNSQDGVTIAIAP